MKELIALDSQRSRDESGHLRIARTVISKAAINSYFGREIPGYKELGLDPDKVYRLLRDPGALQAGTETFKGKPLLIKHEYVDSEDHKKDLVIGAIGSNLEFVDNTVYGDVTVWDAQAIELIESGRMKELSASYWYKAVMRPGDYNGEKYDGIMLEIHGNHVALVTRGRIGPDAIVSDSLPFELEFNMKLKKGTTQRIAAKLREIAKDGVAFDSAAEEVIREVAENIEHKPAFDFEEIKTIVGDDEKFEKIVEILGGKTAEDEDNPEKPEGGADKPAKDEDEGTKAVEERKQLEETDRDDRDAKRDEDKKTAMDADAIAAEVQGRIEAKYKARDKVEPLVGRIALDGFADASAIYAFALKHAGIACDGVNEAGLSHMVTMAAERSKRVIANDEAPAAPSKLTTRFKQA